MRRQWNKKIYIASQLSELDDYGKNQYDEPVMYEFNVQPTTSKNDIQMFGEHSREMQRAVIERKYEGVFKEFDKAYLDGATPEGEEYHGANANYRLLPPRVQNKVITIYFERLVNGDK